MPEDSEEDSESDRAQPTAVGAASRNRAQQRAGRRRLVALVGVLIAVVLGAVLLGPKIFGGTRTPDDFTGSIVLKNDAVDLVARSTTAVLEFEVGQPNLGEVVQAHLVAVVQDGINLSHGVGGREGLSAEFAHNEVVECVNDLPAKRLR